MNRFILLFFLYIAVTDSIAESAHSQLVPIAEACGCIDVPIMPTSQIRTAGNEYRTVRNANTPIYSTAIASQYANQYTNMPMISKKMTRMPRNRKLNPNQVANVLDFIYNVPKSKYVNVSNKNVAQINELNDLRYRLARLAKITRSTAELLSTLPVPSNKHVTNAYNGYTLPGQDLPMTGTPVYRTANVYGTQNGLTEYL